MRIERVRAVPTVSGFFFDDQRAIKRGAEQDGFGYRGEPATPGFDSIRQAGEALTVELELSDGSVAVGDCAAVQYSGAGGRDPLFRAETYRDVVTGSVADELVGRDPEAFADNVAAIEALPAAHGDGDALHTAVRYGVSQALLDAAATARRTTRTDVLAAALETTPATEPVPVFGQSGDDRRANAEKMLLKGVPVLPPDRGRRRGRRASPRLSRVARRPRRRPRSGGVRSALPRGRLRHHRRGLRPPVRPGRTRRVLRRVTGGR